MNTSRIGAEYERAYRHELERMHGMHVTRSAASKGLFDLIASDQEHCYHIQTKCGYYSCREASDHASFMTNVLPPSCKAVVVHRRANNDLEFCEHVG